MPFESPEHNGEKFWFPTPENPGNESEHFLVQQRILRELREPAECGTLDPEKARNYGPKFYHCPNGTIS